jgi:hypothetical protein
MFWAKLEEEANKKEMPIKRLKKKKNLLLNRQKYANSINQACGRLPSYKSALFIQFV